MTPILTVNGISIRPVQVEDLADLYEIASNPLVGRTTNRLPSMEFRETEAWFKNNGAGRYRFVAEWPTQKVVGLVTLNHNQRPRMMHSGGLGLFVHPDYWGKGVGSALMAGVVKFSDEWLDLRRLELEVFADNPAAIHLYEKFGFVIEGTRRKAVFGDGRFHDDHVMARIREVG